MPAAWQALLLLQDLLLETARLARSTYYYQLKQLDGHDKDEETKGEIQEVNLVEIILKPFL